MSTKTLDKIFGTIFTIIGLIIVANIFSFSIILGILALFVMIGFYA